MSSRVGAIEVPKSCDVLAGRLRTQILGGAFAPGEPLPAERDLVAETGLSRGSVREALRILEAEGLLQTRPGRYGGSVVCLPTADLFARQVGSFAKGRGVSFDTLIEAREALEPTLAELAARHRGEADLRELDRIDARMEAAIEGDLQAFLAANVEWHQAVAEASGNDLLAAFIRSIAGLIRESTLEEHVTSNALRRLVLSAHRRVADAIRAKDAGAARRRMERHVKAYSTTIAEERVRPAPALRPEESRA